MAKRPREAKAPTPEEKQAAEQENPPESNGQPQLSKADIVRQAVAEGLDSPGDIVDYAKSRGVEMTKQMASSYKAQQKAREGGTPARTRNSQPQTASIPAGFGSDVREIRALLEKLGGADEAKETIGQLVGLVGKYGSSGLTEIIDALG